MPDVHDVSGGLPDESIDKSEHPLSDRDRKMGALFQVLADKGMIRLDETRRINEELPSAKQSSSAFEYLLIEKGIVTREEVDQKVAELKQVWKSA